MCVWVHAVLTISLDHYSADALFHRSILGLSFPRAAVGAGSFWNYVPELSSSSAQFGRSLEAMG